jgi:N-acetylglutamate synthase-like GNAT family acetyltransferase
MNISMRAARVGEDVAAIKSLLKVCDLPSDIPSDIQQSPDNFFVVTVGGKVVACAGLEVHAPVGLVRSLAVDPAQRSRGFGANLLTRLIDRARELGLSELYGLTTTAQSYLQAHGFAQVERSEAPTDLLNSVQFKSECPSSATLLRINLKS